ncbi:MAG TPA: RelA/SpoT family protein [Tenuifilaceae bacterium]|nr:RelA/SpoT family protein [Tenuifilaceae bacterium]HPN20875.1 RelA/SpoT family protein [Tenuifilaceae bacterium]
MQQYSEKDKRLVLNRYRALLKSVKNVVTKENQKLIRDAFKLSSEINSEVKSDSSNPYIIHLTDVARICVDEIGLGTSSVIAALLHESIERNQLTKIEIEKRFGAKVANIVEGFTRISGLDLKNPKAQSENFRQLIISLSSDARVILIKLADRLETMRSLSYSSNDIQIKRSWETFHLYAPLAHRLGLYRVKSEMEDLSMKFIHSKEYKHIIKKLKETTATRNKFIKEFIGPIEEEIKKRGYEFEIKGRTKSVYSIFRKMQSQQVDFEDVHDIFAIRVILNSRPESEKSDCWQVYSIITDKYTPNTERLRDWISVPKSSGYESLHTTVLGPEDKWVEVQIRTTRMDEIAEKGLAAHWKYKGIRQEQGVDEWVLRVREVLESAETSPEEHVDKLDVDIQASDIYVFTPKGDIRKLPAKSTVLDFAFDIHSAIGAQCTGAIVNGKNVTIKQTLQNGDVIEIITSKKQSPKKDWLSIVVTSKAKTRIKQELRDAENKEIAEGKEILFRRFKNWKIDDADEALSKINKHLKLKKPTDIFIRVAEGKIDPSALKSIIATETLETTDISKVGTQKVEAEKEQASTDFLIIDEKLVNIDYKLAKCCNPIFGDDVFGFVTVSEGIKIHRTSCPNANQLHNRWGYRIVKAKWKGTSKAGAFQSTIKITGADELGILNRISEVISKDLKVNMRNLAINSKNGLFEGVIQLYVEDTKHLEMLLYRLGKVQGVHRAVRVK